MADSIYTSTMDMATHTHKHVTYYPNATISKTEKLQHRGVWVFSLEACRVRGQLTARSAAWTKLSEEATTSQLLESQRVSMETSSAWPTSMLSKKQDEKQNVLGLHKARDEGAKIATQWILWWMCVCDGCRHHHNNPLEMIWGAATVCDDVSCWLLTMLTCNPHYCVAS